MQVELSVGEIIDKYSILEIKEQKIKSTEKLSEIKKEKEVLQECTKYIEIYPFFYTLLIHINTLIWEQTDVIKTLNYQENITQFATISQSIFDNNQKRFRLKNIFNQLLNSNLKEQKSYAQNVCKIVLNTMCLSDFVNKLPEINYLSIEYDALWFEEGNDEIHKIIKQTFFWAVVQPASVYKSTCNLTNFSLQETEQRLYTYNFKTNKPLVYISGGLLGDFIHQLSVVNEMYYKTGRKGLVYMSNIGDPFRFGLDKTRDDIYTLITKQDYILDLKIYNDEPFNINLSSWRTQEGVQWEGFNLEYVFNREYGIKWGKHPWLNLSSLNISENWENKILISTTPYRFPNHFNYEALAEKYGINNLVYFSQQLEHYNDFVNKTNLRIKCYCPVDFTELCVGIKSCRLFVGNLSMPLTVAIASNQETIITIGQDHICGKEFYKLFVNTRTNISYDP
jgi:hypothetical protein